MTTKKTVLITGILGQDGATMAKYLLRHHTAYVVVGMVRHSTKPNYENIVDILSDPRFRLVNGDLTDSTSIDNVVRSVMPDYCINFGANSFVGISWQMPEQVFDTNTMGVLRLLEAIKKHVPYCRFYQAGSSEEFGDVIYSPQDIKHPLRPRSPYGASKCAAHYLIKVYRESYNLYAINGILFNHEGVKRGREFVTRKITSHIAQIYKSIIGYNGGTMFSPLVKPIELGNLLAKRDWSDAEDFVDAIWRMVNQEDYNNTLRKLIDGNEHNHKNPQEAHAFLVKNLKDYIVSSGETHTIKEFIELAFNEADIIGVYANRFYGEKSNVSYMWQGEGLKERYVLHDALNKKDIPLVIINPDFYRLADVELLMGDSTPIRTELGWIPKTDFQQLVKKMVKNDLRLVL